MFILFPTWSIVVNDVVIFLKQYLQYIFKLNDACFILDYLPPVQGSHELLFYPHSHLNEGSFEMLNLLFVKRLNQTLVHANLRKN